MLREAWRKWRVNFLGWEGEVEEDIFWGFLVDEMCRGGMDGDIPPGGERDGYKVVPYRMRGTYLIFLILLMCGVSVYVDW